MYTIQLRRAIIMLSAMLALGLGQPALAVETAVANGTVTDTNGAALSGVQIECNIGNFGAPATTNSSGQYTCMTDSSLLVSGTTEISIQPGSLSGYRAPQQQAFTTK